MDIPGYGRGDLGGARTSRGSRLARHTWDHLHMTAEATNRPELALFRRTVLITVSVSHCSGDSRAR